MNGDPFIFATLYMVRAQICKERKILTLNSWGGGRLPFDARCDPDTNLLYGSLNRDTMLVISFGTPYYYQPPR